MEDLIRKIEDLKKLQQQVFNDLTRKKSEFDKLKEEIEKLQRELPEIKRKKDQTGLSLNSLESKIKILQNDLQQAQKAIEEQKRLFEEYKNEEIKINSQLKEKSAKYNLLKTEVDGLKLRSDELLRQIQKFRPK